jgi:adenosylcobinamide kinase / adenosylcobinamide-phosphate guanylyltransferase
MITFVTGGARSGKSRFGETLLSSVSGPVLYVATAKALDAEMEQRILKHQKDRPASWITLEAYEHFGRLLPKYEGTIAGIYVDCITLMVTQLLLDAHTPPWESMPEDELERLENKVGNTVLDLLHTVKTMALPTVIITNEVGMGIVPGDKMSRDFRDIAGRINQRMAAEADSVYLVVAGIPVKIKG